LVVVGILLFACAAFAQQPPSGSQPPMQMPSGQMEPMDCEAMMQKMQGPSKAMDDRLQALVDEMNKAKGSAKVDRMAAVINELVSQRKQMREQMMAMMPQMMGHMMQHMHSGMMSGMSHSMSGCPMMKGSAPEAQPPAAEHKH
jgi:polyhydroxyalkanoate synthesis regulator phasin